MKEVNSYSERILEFLAIVSVPDHLISLTNSSAYPSHVHDTEAGMKF